MLHGSYLPKMRHPELGCVLQTWLHIVKEGKKEFCLTVVFGRMIYSSHAFSHQLFTAAPATSHMKITQTGLELSFFFIVHSLSHVWLLVTPWAATYQASLSFKSPGVCSNSCALSEWCHPTISFSVVPFSSCPQSFPAPVSLPVNWLFASGGQSIEASASALFLPMNKLLLTRAPVLFTS